MQTSTPEQLDPVCGMTVDPATAAARRRNQGRDIWFCSTGCAERFDAHPKRYPAAITSPTQTPNH